MVAGDGVTLSPAAPRRPVMRYFGGKFRLREFVISHFPPHRVYTEAFGGAASVLMAKPRCYAEILGDLDGEITGLFRVLRNREHATELERLLRLTPFARAEFEAVYERDDDPVEQARRTLVKSYMGFGSNAVFRDSPNCGMRTRASTWRPPTGFRSNSKRSGTTPAHDWMRYPDQIKVFTERLQGVVIETRNALDVISQYDTHDCLHFVDPPYVMSTRGDTRKDYRFEMSHDDHADLSELLGSVEGYVVLCGYPSALYEDLYRGWHRLERSHLADSAKKTTEVLWLSPRTIEALEASKSQGDFWGFDFDQTPKLSMPEVKR